MREWQEEGGGGEESGDESEDEGGEEGGEGADLERDELRGSATGAGSEGESGSVNASEVGKEERGSILSSSLSPEALGALEEDPSRAYASERGAEEVGDRGNAAAGNHGSGTGSQDATPSGSSDEAGDDPGRSSGEPSTSGERLDEADASGDGLRAPRGLWHRRRTQEALMVIMRMQLLSFAAAALVEELPRGEGRQELLEVRATWYLTVQHSTGQYTRELYCTLVEELSGGEGCQELLEVRATWYCTLQYSTIQHSTISDTTVRTAQTKTAMQNVSFSCISL